MEAQGPGVGERPYRGKTGSQLVVTCGVKNGFCVKLCEAEMSPNVTGVSM